MAEFDDLIKKKSKDWKAPHMMENALKSRGKKIPFSSPLANWATYGGIPRDKITEFFGDPGGGKTTTSIDICSTAAEIFREEWEQRCTELREDLSTKEKKLELSELEESGPRRVLYIDLEHAFDMEWAKTLDVDTEAISIMQPPDISAEEILQMVEDMIKTNEVGLIVLDSIPSLTPQAELDKKYGERTVAALAGLLTVFCRKVVSLLTRYHTTLLVINQTRDNMDNPYVVNTPGGRALKFYASLRIQFSLGSPIDILGNELPKKAEDPAGYLVDLRLHKQKTAPFDRKNASYYLLASSGISPEMDYAQLAIKKYGIISKSGSWFTISDPYTGEILEKEDGSPLKKQGMPAVYDYLSEDVEYFNRLKKFIEDDINGVKDEEVENDSAL